LFVIGTRETVGSDDFCEVYRGVCMYCKNLVMALSSNREDSYTGCGIRKEDGKYIDNDVLSGKISFFRGCCEFRSSGIPIHPLLAELLISQNPLAKSIPVSEQVQAEHGILFEQRVYDNLPNNQRVSVEDIG